MWQFIILYTCIWLYNSLNYLNKLYNCFNEVTYIGSQEDWVLCRVFHKGKAMAPNSENSNKLSPQLTFETTSYAPNNQTMPCGFTSFASTPCHQNHNHSNSLLNLLQFAQGTDTNNEISSKGDDEYGFLWDMNLEEDSLENGAPSNLEEIRFEIDNSMVFLWNIFVYFILNTFQICWFVMYIWCGLRDNSCLIGY